MAVLSCASATPPEVEDKDQYILATVLFYCNKLGDKIVAAGKVPRKVKFIIKKNVGEVYKNTSIKVVPIYRNYSDVPKMDEVYTEIKKKHNVVLVAPLSQSLATRLVVDKSNLFKEKGKVSGLEHFYLQNFKRKPFKGEDVEANVISAHKQDDTEFGPFYRKAEVPVVEMYLPNTVFYSTQIKHRSNDKIIQSLLRMLK